ncbi:MAG: BrnT family toxin [Chthoniobacterales bacterium]
MWLEFDPDKEAVNLAKHGIDFSTVQKVFEDPQRMIVPNETHSSDEPRFYAVGHDGHGILTVRFTLRYPRGHPRHRRRILAQAEESL